MSPQLNRFLERYGITADELDRYICRCEDFPCCGHDRADRYTTYRDLFRAERFEVMKIDEEMW
jgi:hypothetical protein